MDKEIWNIEKIQKRALELGKKFDPNPEIAGRLEPDLANGAMVLFTQEEVEKAIKDGQVPREWKEPLIELVVDKNDTAIILSGEVQRWKSQQLLMSTMKRRGR